MEDTSTRRYSSIIVDSVNFAYRTFRIKGETPLQISKKSIYRASICNFIDAIESLKEKYLQSDGVIYLLFDNYFSRSDLRSTYMFADRKELSESYKSSRKKESREFYNSINFIRYYYLVGPSMYRTARIDNLEADDLVEPLLNIIRPSTDSKALMVTTDADWTRYLSDSTDWLPDLSSVPETSFDLSNRMGFRICRDSVILFKTMFGDKSDNIKGIVTDNETNRKEFTEIMSGKIPYPEYFIEMSRNEEMRERYGILKKISEDERQFLINLQLISPIPCSSDTLRSHLTVGRNSDTLYRTIREVMGLQNPGGFIFGNVKRNRIS